MQIGFVREFDGRLYPFSAIHIEGKGSTSQTLAAVVDTGFDGWLALPSSVINSLDLEPIGEVDLELANSKRERVFAYRTDVIWAERRFSVVVHETGNQATIGMNLLRDHHLDLDVTDLGPINLEPLESSA